MSIHHLSLAGELDMPATKKLVFMAICDDASNDSGLGFPGMDKIVRWSRITSKSRILELIGELIADGYLERTEAGRRGHRAVFRVFARVACCPMHDPFIGSATADPTDLGSGTADPNDDLGSGIGSGIGSDSYRTPPISPVSPIDISAVRKQRGLTEFPEGWEPNEKHADYAGEHGLTLSFEASQFENHHKSKGSKFRNWDAAFRTWLGNQVRWSGPRLQAAGEDRRPEWMR